MGMAATFVMWPRPHSQFTLSNLMDALYKIWVQLALWLLIKICLIVLLSFFQDGSNSSYILMGHSQEFQTTSYFLIGHHKKDCSTKGGSKISGKGVHMYQGVGVLSAEVITFFLNIRWKRNNLVSQRPNYFIFIGYLKTSAMEGFKWAPWTPLDPPLSTYFLIGGL